MSKLLQMSITKEDRWWSSFGFGLNKVFIPPHIRTIQIKITEYYKKLRDQDGIHSGQDFNNNLQRKMGKKLQWQNINGNDPRADPESYDYNIRDELSLAKLFLMPELAKRIEALDESLDASCVLNLIELVPVFPKWARDAARQLKIDGRIEWAHVNRNFSYWTEEQYNECFQIMENLVNGLGHRDKRYLVDQLENWRINGEF